jgi:hypothetical protein
MLSENFAWHLNRNTVSESYVNPYGTDNTTDSMQFTHVVFNNSKVNSDHYGLISLLGHHLMLKENVDTSGILRIKANLNTIAVNYPEGHHYSTHVDFPKGLSGTTCIYYVNDSDGDTIFFEEDGVTEIERVSPKKGRFVYFDSSIPHAGSPPKNHQVRCVINLNFI